MVDDPYFLIRRSHLPDVLKRTTQVSELLEQHPEISVITAVKQVGISRSAYYKYKDVVRPFYSTKEDQMVTVALTLRHEAGVLSEVLNTLAALMANILTINQSLPLQGLATVIISMEISNMRVEPSSTLSTLSEIPGVEQVSIVGRG